MSYFVLGLLVLVAFLLIGRMLTRIPAAKVAKHARLGGVALLVGLAGLLLLTGRFGAMSQVFALANQAMRTRSMFKTTAQGFADVDGAKASGPGQGAEVTTAYLTMSLDEATGAVNGCFVAGLYAGRSLDACSEQELISALTGMADDGESVRLLEAYLDRTFARWRENHDQWAAGGSTSAPDTGSMGEDEAYQVLGLEPGADASAIRTAHRRLMGTIHPDRGGSTYLAAKVNLAKEVLLKLHR